MSLNIEIDAISNDDIKSVTGEGDVVLDPFCGSGTTLVAAEAIRREYIGIDMNEEAERIHQYKRRKVLGFLFPESH